MVTKYKTDFLKKNKIAILYILPLIVIQVCLQWSKPEVDRAICDGKCAHFSFYLVGKSAGFILCSLALNICCMSHTWWQIHEPHLWTLFPTILSLPKIQHVVSQNSCSVLCSIQISCKLTLLKHHGSRPEHFPKQCDCIAAGILLHACIHLTQLGDLWRWWIRFIKSTFLALNSQRRSMHLSHFTTLFLTGLFFFPQLRDKPEVAF